MERRVALCLTAAASLWTAAILLVPLVHHHPAGGLTPLVRMAGSLVCHQRAERSFTIDGQTLPVCARCTGLYVSGAAGAVLAWMAVPLMPRHTRSTILLAAIPTVATVAVEWTGLAHPGNLIRAAAAVPIGAACGWLFVRMLRAEAPATCVIIS